MTTKETKRIGMISIVLKNELVEHVSELMVRGRKIQAIAYVRKNSLVDLGLKSAKDIVEKIHDGHVSFISYNGNYLMQIDPLLLPSGWVDEKPEWWDDKTYTVVTHNPRADLAIKAVSVLIKNYEQAKINCLRLEADQASKGQYLEAQKWQQVASNTAGFIETCKVVLGLLEAGNIDKLSTLVYSLSD